MQIDSEGGAKRQYKGSLDCARQVFAKEGLVRGLYAGISAGIFRQLSYGMPRMAFYPMLLDRFKEPEGQTCALPPLTTDARHWSPRRANARARRRMSFAKKLALGSIAGSTAALLGVPSEVCLVRMGADSKKCARPHCPSAATPLAAALSVLRRQAGGGAPELQARRRRRDSDRAGGGRGGAVGGRRADHGQGLPAQRGAARRVL